MLQPGTFALTLLLSFLTALGPLSMDMYPPSLPDIGRTLSAPVVQVLGGAGAIVLARAVVRDLYSGVRAGRELSLMGAITGVAPIVAPVIGGGLQTFFGWRATFVVLVICALVIGATAARLLPETLRERPKTTVSLREMSALYRSVAVPR